MSGRVGIDGFAGPSDLTVIALRRAPTRARWRLDLLAQAEHGEDSLVGGGQRRRSALLRRAARRPRSRAARTTWTPRWRSPRRSRPSTSSSPARPPRRSRRACARAGCLFVGVDVRHRVRRLRGGFEPHAADRRRRALRLRPQRRATSAAAWPRCALGDAARRARRAPASPIAAAEGFAAHAESMAARVENPRPMTRTAQITPQDRRDRRLAHARPRRHRRRHAHAPASASSTTCSTCSPATAGSTSTSRSPATSQTGAHHTVEDTGIVLGQALDQALGDRARDPPLRPRGRADGRGARRRARSTSPAGRTAPSSGFERLPAGRHRRLRARGWRRSSSAPWRSAARLTLHLDLQAGTNAHHMIEACFKAFARALRVAVSIDPDETGVPSTKGTLT